MEQQVQEIINNYKGLVVIGYAGNDDSVMKILDHFPNDEEKNLFWCVYKDTKINWKVEKVLKSKRGYLIRMDGFDKFMIDLAKIEGIRFSDLIESLLERNKLIIDKFTNFNLDKKDSEYQHEEKSIERQHKKLQNALKVMQLLTLGNRYFEEKNYRAAEEKYEEAKELKKNEADTHYNYAKVVSFYLSRSDLATFHLKELSN